MKNLILADLKVLGHRIWAVPLGVFLFIFSFSFIPYLDQVYKFQNWIFSILIPGLLTYELFREEQKNNSASTLLAMPVSKERYIISRITVIILFGIIASLTGIVSNSLLLNINGIEIPDKGILSYGYDYINPVIWSLKFILFILPVYFYTGKLKTSISIAFITILIHGYFMELYIKFFRRYYLNDYLSDYFLSLAVVIIGAVCIHLILKIKFINSAGKYLKEGWFTVMMFLALMTYQTLMDNLEFAYIVRLYIKFKNYKDVTSEQLEHVNGLLNKFITFSSVYLAVLIIIFIILILLRKRIQDKFISNAILYLFTPAFILILETDIFQLLRELIPVERLPVVDITSYPLFKIPMLIGLTAAVIVSMRASLHLLKNNRRLS